MLFREKKLYHQIHPVKLLTDVSTGFFTTYLLWKHNIFWFLLIFILPSVIVSVLLIKFADLKKQKESRFGKYITKYMTPFIEFIRLAGQVVMWIAAWYHAPFIILIGFALIIGAWCKGLF